MACDTWRDRIDLYADGELSDAEARAMGEHLRDCPSCTSDLLGRLQWKRAIQTAGKRYTASAELRQRVLAGAPNRTAAPASRWHWWPQLAAGVAVLVIAVLLFHSWSGNRQAQTIAELADMHVSTLASATPVDVISTDRHTVKPWFAGRIPFTFNLPELGGTPFQLEGGRVSYLEQSPGAQLIFRDGNHRISVFIFQSGVDRGLALGDSRSKRLTFNVETWTEGNLSYYVIGDAESAAIHELSEMLQAAARAS